MANVTVIGAQWGDEGKGKVIDWLADRAEVVVRFQGGNNAGHTIVVGNSTYKFSLLPSGVVQGKLSIIGNGVVVNPWALLEEIERVRGQGLDINPANLVIADNAVMVLPLHGEIDKAREDRAGANKIGTTARGVGPAYEDKVGRRAIRFIDLFVEQPPLSGLLRRFLTGASIALLIIAALSVSLQLNNSAREGRRLADIEQRQAAIASQTAALVQGMVDSETGMRGYAITNETAYLEPYEDGRAAATRATAALANLIAEAPALKTKYDLIVQREAAVATIIDESVGLARTGQGKRALIASVAEGKKAMDALRAAAETLSEAASRQVLDAAMQARAVRMRTNGLILALIVLFVISNGVTGFMVLRERRQMAALSAALAQANATLSQARATAEAADAAKTRFLALASHDMRQPLHAMTLYLAALGRRVEGQQAKEILGNMEMAAQSLTRMFSGLLDLARIESGVLQAKPVTTRLQAVFDAVTTELKDDAKRTKTDVRVVHTEEPVFTDPELLESIVRNLVTNALKYAGGGRVLIGARRQGDFMRIEVHDEGPGIPSDKLMFVFGEFVRLDSTPSGVEGLGLGLSIASRLAKLLGQTLAAKSEVGKGTTFSIAVPRAAPRQDVLSAAAIAPRPDLTGLNVGVLDDDALALAAMAAVLEDAGANVQAMTSSKQYIEALDAGAQHDVLILDPVLLAEASRAVRDRPDYATPPLIVVTGSTDAAALARLEASQLAWLIKPVKEDKLIRLVSRVVMRARERAERETS